MPGRESTSYTANEIAGTNLVLLRLEEAAAAARAPVEVAINVERGVISEYIVWIFAGVVGCGKEGREQTGSIYIS